MSSDTLNLPWVAPGTPLPSPQHAWPAGSDAPGLLAAGADLSVSTLINAYSHGIFPWFSRGKPILWWSPDPRMVLHVANFKLSRSLKKTLQHFIKSSACEIRIDTDFEQVIHSCAHAPRRGQNGTWIVPEMIQAYSQLHQAGFAHSIETWINGQLVGGLYCVAFGRAVFGESMFTKATDASKIALCALVAFCKKNDVRSIDCQQNTSHLASLGAAEVKRHDFLEHIKIAQTHSSPHWQFELSLWDSILHTEP